MRCLPLLLLSYCIASGSGSVFGQSGDAVTPDFGRHVTGVYSRLGCNSGTCHGAVQGKNGFRLSLFAARPDLDHNQIVFDQPGRRINLQQPENSLLLRKATAAVPHGGGQLTKSGSADYEILRRWIAGGAKLENLDKSRLAKLTITPREHVLAVGGNYQLKVEAEFVDGSKEDVTALCGYESLDAKTAAVDLSGQVRGVGPGDVAIRVRYRDEPAMAIALVSRGGEPVAKVAPHNFIDEHVLAKLQRLNIPSADVTDDATFLRRVRLDVIGRLPLPDEVRAFQADTAADKRAKKIEQLLAEPGYAALWTLKFCDLLGASQFGNYADALGEQFEAPRFQAWVRARLEENLPYDEFAARILLATSREGRSLEEWSQEVIALQEGYTTPRKDLEIYSKRKTLDAYWQRKDAVGVPGAMQVAHTFLGLRLQCAQCHRHPHDVWQQDDLLSFANLFMRVRTVGFQGDNEKKFADDAKLFKQFEGDGKRMAEEAKKLKEGEAKQLAETAKKAQGDLTKLKNEIKQSEQQIAQHETQAADRRKQADALPADKAADAERLRTEADELAQTAKALQDAVAAKRNELAPLEKSVADNDAMQAKIRDLERRGKLLGDEVAKRVLHAQIMHLTSDDAQKKFASITSPLGTQSSQQFRLLGEKAPLTIGKEDDPRAKFVEWLRRPDNPFFAKAIVNRVWAHYFDRGLIDPPDDLSPFNPATHPALLDDLAKRFVENKYDLKWLHRTILLSRTYQQSSGATPDNQADRTNYARFYLRRLPAEVLLDVLNQATGTRDDFDMKYNHWPDNLTTVEAPYLPRNGFVAFVLEQFGKSERNSSAQCDCQRVNDPSMLQVLSLANHPNVWKKIADPKGRAADIIKQHQQPRERIEAVYLCTLSRLPDAAELAASEKHLAEAESPEKGLQAVLWSLLNTREFLLQH